MKYIVIKESEDGDDIVWLNGEAELNNLQLSDIIDDKVTCTTVADEMSKLFPRYNYTVRCIDIK